MRRPVAAPHAARFLAAAVAAALVVALCSLLSACAPVPHLTTEQKLADFDYLFATFRDNHPFLFLKARVEGYDWLAHEAEFREAIRQTKDNAEFAKAIWRIVSLVGNAHTAVVNGAYVSAAAGASGPWSDAAARTTVRIADYWDRLSWPSQATAIVHAIYSGGEYYVSKSSIAGLSAGARLVAVDGVPIHDYIPSLRGTRYLSWDPLRRRLYAMRLSLFAGQQETVSAENRVGAVDTFPVQGERPRGYTYFPVTPDGAVIVTRTLGAGQVGYVHVRSMTKDEADKVALRAFFEQVKDLPALIIDIRGNPGGSTPGWKEHIVGQLAAEPISVTVGMAHRPAQLAQSCVRTIFGEGRPWVSAEDLVGRNPLAKANLPPELLTDDFSEIMLYELKVSPAPDSVRYQGKIFLLVDDVVYSAAEQFAVFAKASGWATVVGSCTG
ncbi:MAG: S41 family peptidase, partial [Bacillota bacterium]|nr:S41 family peptidase [Bacillota bacterium]